MRLKSTALAFGLVACGTGKIELGDTGYAGLDTGVGTSDACPRLELSDRSIQWAGTAAGTPSFQTLKLTNFCVGEGALDVVVALSSEVFQVDQTTALAEPGESVLLTLAFNPSNYDLHEEELLLTTNETGSPSYTIALTGRAQADMDGDGFEAVVAGGEDCDDANPDAYPGAEEVWYDGVDQDCNGGSDYDQDGDGFDHQDYGGADCDDEQADVNPDSEEVWYDGVDQDCSGGSDYDQDGDGFDFENYGGGDCDDERADVNPNQADVWYDGVDQDCSGGSDFDQDGDGGDSADYGGDDCDDQDPSVFYDSGERTEDGLDDDCDGLIDEDFLPDGAVILSELMIDPDEVADSAGEWMEVYNTTNQDISLMGWSVEGSDGNAFTVTDSVVVPAFGHAVFGVSADPASNGGVDVDFAYDYNSFKLSNDEDDLTLMAGSLVMSELVYHEDDIELDEGRTINLDPAFMDQTSSGDLTYWCLSRSRYGDGDRGTPQEQNDACEDNDLDGDGYSRNDGDCDESDADINPDAVEDWDGEDNDCNNLTDDLEIDAAAVGYLHGQYSDFLGYWQGLSIGDLDDDGQEDILIGGLNTQDYYYDGGFHVVDGSAYSGYAGAADQNDYALVNGASYYNYMSYLPRNLGDQDADGVVDLFVVASDIYYSNLGNRAGGLFFGSSSFYGTYDIGDADVLFTGASSYGLNHASVSQFDLDGDGMDELFYSDNAHGSNVGVVYGMSASSLVSGSTYDWSSDADYTWVGADSQDQHGSSLGGGDIDADGYDDLLIAAPYADQGSADSGSVYLILGGASSSSDSDPEREAHVIFYGDDPKNHLSRRSAPVVGDFDEDGKADVILAAPDSQELYFFSDAGALSGKVNTSSADATITGDGPAYFGLSMDVGDVDGDGEDDLLVGAPDYTDVSWYAGQYADEPGRVYLFTGDPTDYAFGSEADAQFTGRATGDLLGASVALGDISGDGLDDILVASPNEGTSSTSYPTEGYLWILEAP